MSARGRQRRADVQGLRAVAVLLVVAFHSGLHLPGGFTGVDVFFVISGFVITRMLAGELESTGGIRLLRFYGRRVKRLLPALATVVVFVMAAGVLLSPFGAQTLTAKTGVATALFGANGYLYAVTDTYFNRLSELDPLLHTWTLAVEEQFYLAFPAILLIAWGAGAVRRRAHAFAAIAAVTALSFVLSVCFSYGIGVPASWPRPATFAFYSSPTRAWEFGVGALLALSEARLARLGGRTAGLLALAGLAAIVAGAVAAPDVAHFPGLFALVPVLGAAAAIAGGTVPGSPVTRALETAPATWLGDRSYSWYLWHWPFIADARALWPGSGWAAPVAAVVSLAPAWASYRYVENPIRFSPRIQGRRILATGVACVAASVAAAGVLVLAHHELGRLSVVQAEIRSQVLHIDFRHGCMDSTEPVAQRIGGPCSWNVRHPRGLIVLIGDSNAGHFAEPTIAGGERDGYDVVADTYSGCPFVAVRVTAGLHSIAWCHRAIARALRQLVALRPALVVTADRTDGYIATRHTRLGAEAGGPLTDDPPRKVRLWEQGLTQTLEALNAAHIPVLLVHPVPSQPGVTLGSCAVVRLLVQGCDSPVRRVVAARELRTSVAAEDLAAARASETTTLEVSSSLCAHGICPTSRGGVRLYLDARHLSVAGAALLDGTFARAIVRAMRHGRKPGRSLVSG